MEKNHFPSQGGILRRCNHPKAVHSKYTLMAEGIPGAGTKLQRTVCSPTVGKPHLSALGATHLRHSRLRALKVCSWERIGKRVLRRRAQRLWVWVPVSCRVERV